MKDLHKIIILFLIIFALGITSTVISINRTLDKSKPVEAVEAPIDSTKYLPKNKKSV